MELDGLLGDPELLRDRLVRKTTRDRTDDPELTFGQPGILCGSFTRVLGDACRGEDVPLEGLPQNTCEMVWIDRLDDVRVRPTFQCCLDQLRDLRDRQH